MSFDKKRRTAEQSAQDGTEEQRRLMVLGEKRTRITYGLPGSLGLPCTTAIARPGTTGLATHLMSASRTMFMTSAGGSASTKNEALHASSHRFVE